MSKNAKKTEQLGMPIGTASNRLRKSLLWDYIVRCGDNTCYQCGSEILSIDDLSIEHKVPWLDSEDPQGLFFDLKNIGFSHLSCNISAARKVTSPCGTWAAYCRGCRCPECKEASKQRSRNYYNPEVRRERYLRNEKI